MAPDRALALAQGAFYVATGAWPILHDRSFQAVTGPKRDLWLVKTAGVLVAAIGGSLLIAAGRSVRVMPETRALAIGSALGLAGIDLVYVSRGTIRRVYLLDAAAELALAAGWALASRVKPPTRAEGPTSRLAGQPGGATVEDADTRQDENQPDARDQQEPIGEAFGNARDRRPDGPFDAYREGEDEQE